MAVERYRSSRLKEQYLSALKEYLVGAGEAPLQLAYELGREAIATGMGVLDMEALCQEALMSVLSGVEIPEESTKIIKMSSSFFKESLAPFELTHRSFQEANTELRRITTSLEQQVAERTKALSEANLTLQAIIQSSPLAIYTLDREGRVRSWNQAAERIFGWSEEETMGRIFPAVPEEKLQEFRELRERVFQGESVAGEERRRRRKDGSPIDVIISSAPLYDAEGKISSIMAVVADITERKKAEQEREQLFNRLKTVHQITNIAVSSLDMSDTSQRVLISLGERFGLVTATIFVVDEERRELLPAALWGYPPEYLRSIPPLRVDSDYEAARVFRSGTPAIVEDVNAPSVPKLAKEAAKKLDVLIGTSFMSYIILPLAAYQKTIGVIALSWPTTRKFSQEDIDFFVSIAHEITVGLENARLHAQTIEELSRTKLLQDVAIAATTNPDIHRIGEEVLRAFNKHIQLGSGDIRQMDKDKQVLRLVAYFGYSEEIAKSYPELPLSRTDLITVQAAIKNKIVTHKEDVATQQKAELLKELGLENRRYVAMPVTYRNEIIGTFSLTFDGKRDFTQNELELFNSVAYITGQAIENARLYEVERHIADTLQKSLLVIPETIAGVEYGYIYRSATEAAQVGGDFYDIFELEHEQIGIVVGDVSGKGIEATTLTSVVKNAVKAYAYEDGTPAMIVSKTNDVLSRVSSPGSFVTVLFAVLDIKTGRLSYCSAGHPPSMITRKKGGVDLLEKHSPIIGAFPGLHYRTGKEKLERGDVLILYTDGITEARRGGEFLGEERLIELVRSLETLSAKEVPRTILNSVSEFAGGNLTDDVAILAVSLKGN